MSVTLAAFCPICVSTYFLILYLYVVILIIVILCVSVVILILLIYKIKNLPKLLKLKLFHRLMEHQLVCWWLKRKLCSSASSQRHTWETSSTYHKTLRINYCSGKTTELRWGLWYINLKSNSRLRLLSSSPHIRPNVFVFILTVVYSMNIVLENVLWLSDYTYHC